MQNIIADISFGKNGKAEFTREELEKLLSAAYTAGAKGRGLAFECRADGKNAAVIYYEGENVIFRGNTAKGGEKSESE